MFEFLAKRLLTSWSRQQVLGVEVRFNNPRINKKKLTRRLSGNPFKNIVNKAVENSHGLVGDTGIRMDLL
jgi:hypothetical protein